MARRHMKFFGTAAHFGTDYEIELSLRFGDTTHVVGHYIDSRPALVIDAHLEPRADWRHYVDPVIRQICCQYEEMHEEPPTPSLCQCWAKALEDLWGSVML